MKKIFKSLAVLLISFIVALQGVEAALYVPDSFVSDDVRILEYIENFRIYRKTANNGANDIYCLNLDKYFDKGVTFKKKDKVDKGFVYILENRPKTSDKDKDFYITQMAVWYYQDYLNNNNENIIEDVKLYILSHRNNNAICKKIYELYEGAKNYKVEKAVLKINTKTVTFTKVDDYYESNEISMTMSGITIANIRLDNAPKGTKLISKDNGNLVVKVPVSQIPEGKEVKITLDIEGNYSTYTAYYFHASSEYQNMLYSEYLEIPDKLKVSLPMVIQNANRKYEVLIDKTDITLTNEVPGASLVVKDSNNNVIDSWISTNESHKLVLPSGHYSLTETIAPEGYKLNKSVVYFDVTNDGKVLVDNKVVSKVIMINELKNSVIIKKLDKDTDAFVTGAKLVIKNSKNEVVKEFISDGKAFSLVLDAGEYSISELSAPEGYLINNEVIYFTLSEDGTLKVKNNKGEYTDSNSVIFYNTKEDEEEVEVEDTDASNTLLFIGGIALLIGGTACVKKTIKEC